MEQQYAIELKNVGKKIKDRWILQNINIRIPKGEIYGFIGPNGAGKTTLIKIMSGLSRYTTGSVKIFNKTVGGHHIPSDVGILVEYPAFVPELSGMKNLELLASIRNKIGKREIQDAIRMVGLDPDDKKRVGAYSLGMRERLGIAQAIMEFPSVLLLDEPTNGLDPKGIVELRYSLFDLSKKGTTIFLSSHLLHEVEQLCNRVAIVNKGKIVEEINKTNNFSKRIIIRVTGKDDWAKLCEWSLIPQEKRMKKDKKIQFKAIVETNVPVHNIIEQLVMRGISIESITPYEEMLEEAFLNTVGVE